MDTSKEYMKMCKKAVEIQELYWSEEWCKQTENDWRNDYKACQQHRVILKIGDKDPCPAIEGNFCLRKKNEIWLPRQDQLQEIIKGVTAIQIMNIFIKYHWQDVRLYKYRELFQTLEQHWLAFIMKEKYHKIWNGEDWIK